MQGCVCGLTFQKRVNQQHRQPLTFSFDEWCKSIFRDTLSEFLKIEKKYDDQTDHRLNQKKQQQWQLNIISTLKQFKQSQQVKKRLKHKTPKNGSQVNQNLNLFCKQNSETKEQHIKQKNFSIHKLKRFSRNFAKIEQRSQKIRIKSYI